MVMIIKILNVVLRKLLGGYMDTIIAKVVEKVISNMSPSFRASIEEYVSKLEEIAAKTANPWDDILVTILKVVLNIK